jgi:hypothetical protein
MATNSSRPEPHNLRQTATLPCLTHNPWRTGCCSVNTSYSFREIPILSSDQDTGYPKRMIASFPQFIQPNSFLVLSNICHHTIGDYRMWLLTPSWSNPQTYIHGNITEYIVPKSSSVVSLHTCSKWFKARQFGQDLYFQKHENATGRLANMMILPPKRLLVLGRHCCEETSISAIHSSGHGWIG